MGYDAGHAAMYGRQLRSAVRLKAGENSGTVALRRLNTPPIMCDLQDISEMGCRCVARVRINDWSDAEKWRLLLRTGELYEAEVTFDPYIPFIRLPIEIRSSIGLPGNGYEIGLAFFDLEPDHRQMLNKAMISIATEKIRSSKGVLKSELPKPNTDPIKPSLPTASQARLSAVSTRTITLPSDALGADVERKTLQPAAESATPAAAKLESPAPPELKLGEALNRSGHLSSSAMELDPGVREPRDKNEQFGDYVTRESVLTPLQILQARSAQTGLAYVNFDMSKIPMRLLDLFPFSKMRLLKFVPFESEGDTVRIACANPLSKNDGAMLERICGMKIETFLCREDLPQEFLEGVARRFERYRRAQPRYKVSLPASFQCSTPDGPMLTDAMFRGRTVDLSEGGMQVMGPVIIGVDPEHLFPGALKMMVTIGAVPEDIVGVCETRHIRYVRNSGGGTTCIYGLKLDQMSEPHRDIFQNLIARVTRAQTGLNTTNDAMVEMATPLQE